MEEERKEGNKKRAEIRALKSFRDRSNKVMEEATKADSNANSEAETTENESEKTDKAAESEGKEDGLTESRADNSANHETVAISTGKVDNVEVQAADALSRPIAYIPIDI